MLQVELGQGRVVHDTAVFLDLRLAGLLVEMAAVDAVGEHGVGRVAQGDHAREHRDLLALQSVGIAAAVPALVVVADAADDLAEVAPQRLVAPERHMEALFAACQHFLHDLRADGRMALHRGKFVVRQAARGQQHRVGDADFADIVDRGRDLGLALLLGTELHDLGKIRAHLRDAPGVLAAVAVLGLERENDARKRGVEEVEQKVKVKLFVKAQHIAEHVFQVDQRTESRLAQRMDQLFVQGIHLLVDPAEVLPVLECQIQHKIQQQEAAEKADRLDRGVDARGENADCQHLVHGGKDDAKGQLRALSPAL